MPGTLEVLFKQALSAKSNGQGKYIVCDYGSVFVVNFEARKRFNLEKDGGKKKNYATKILIGVHY